jgi:FtsH-binding integral membrane protein
MSPSPIDARGPQFNASLTSAVLVLALLTAQTPVGVAVLALQAVLFAIAVAFGVQRAPAAWIFRRVVRPRLGPATRWEDPRPPRFAQGIGLAFTLAGLAGFTLGPTWLGYTAIALALIAALLNATVQICLGCRIYGICHLPQETFPTRQRFTITDTKEVAA